MKPRGVIKVYRNFYRQKNRAEVSIETYEERKPAENLLNGHSILSAYFERLVLGRPSLRDLKKTPF